MLSPSSLQPPHQKFSSKQFAVSKIIAYHYNFSHIFFYIHVLRALTICVFALNMLTLILCALLRVYSQAYKYECGRKRMRRDVFFFFFFSFCVWCAHIRVQRKLKKKIPCTGESVFVIFLFILHTWWFTIFDSTFVIGWMLFADDELNVLHTLAILHL